MTLVLGVLVAPGPAAVACWVPTGDMLPITSGPVGAVVDKGGKFDKDDTLETIPPLDKGGTIDMGGTDDIGGTADICGTLERGGTAPTGGKPGINDALEEVVEDSGGTLEANGELKDKG